MSNWKRAESQSAKLFGSRRRPLSGSNQGEGYSDDMIHDTIYLESKYRVKHTTWSLWRDTKAKAIKEGKIPVISLKEKGKSGTLLVIHSDHLAQVLAALVSPPENPEGPNNE